MFAIDNVLNQKATSLMNFGGTYMPLMYTYPQDELLACRTGAWLGSFLNLSPVYDISGPDAVEFLNYVSVNRDYSKMKVGGSRHTIICNEKGQMMADGVLMRKEENLYRTYWLAPVIAFYAETLDYDVQGKWVYDEFFIQIDGPKSLEIMEKVSGKDLHDLKFARHTDIVVAGVPTTIHRLGMSGCLAYEMHGDMSKLETVYEAIMEAGEEFGIKRLGWMNYCRNHTQGGYPNQWIHYYYPTLLENEEMKQYIAEHSGYNIMMNAYNFYGSASDDIQNAFVTPFDVKWEYLINYDHDFIGKDALLKIKEDPKRTVVTLEWDPADIGACFAEQFKGKFTLPFDDISNMADGAMVDFFVISKIMNGDKMVGVATGRERDFYHNTMISLAFLDKEHAVEGTELTVLWGTNPKTVFPIKVKVAQFPYYNEEFRNETFDTSNIPRRF